MCGHCGQLNRHPCATKIGDPHMHICGCGHRWVAPLGSDPPCPGCTDEYGHSWHDRTTIAIARGAIERFGLDAIMRK